MTNSRHWAIQNIYQTKVWATTYSSSRLECISDCAFEGITGRKEQDIFRQSYIFLIRRLDSIRHDWLIDEWMNERSIDRSIDLVLQFSRTSSPNRLVVHIFFYSLKSSPSPSHHRLSITKDSILSNKNESMRCVESKFARRQMVDLDWKKNFIDRKMMLTNLE